MNLQIAVNPNFTISPYAYEIGHCIFEQNLEIALNQYNKVVLITDEVINELYLETLKVNVPKIVLKPGEQAKSFSELEILLEKLSELSVKRNDLIVAVGGGVIGDLAGFAASIYMRGVAYWQVPTTLVAMVDSAIGGKTGINTKFGKNLVGAFYHPKKIIADLNFLEKLPESEIKNGLAEMFKHSLIANISLIEELKKNPIGIDSIINSAKVKIDIVETDVFEKRERKYLNIGHTVAHAIEKESTLAINHGQAVAIGIKVESKIANKLGILKNEDLDLILNSLKDLQIDYDYKIKDLSKFIGYMKQDKKNVSDKISFALVAIPGKKTEVIEVSVEEVSNLLNEIC